MIDTRRLNVVDEEGRIIGEATREEIHRKGLLHREINVWFYTPRGEIIFQHRAKDKDTFPDLLDATVGGHVEIGQDYETAALQEIREETGVVLTRDQLQIIETTKKKFNDAVTSAIYTAIRVIYACSYDGRVKNLRVEKDKALGFEVWPINRVLHATAAEQHRWLPRLSEPDALEIFRKIQMLL